MKNFLTWTARLALAGVFLYAAIPKIADPAGFAKAIYNYQMLPDATINLLAIGLPWLELIVAACLLLLPPLRKGATALIAFMLVIFIVAIGSAVARGINIDCGCFSTSGQGMKTGAPHLILDAALLVVALLLLRKSEATIRVFTAEDRSPPAA